MKEVTPTPPDRLATRGARPPTASTAIAIPFRNVAVSLVCSL